MNDVENGCFLNYLVKNGNFFVNDFEGNWFDKIYLVYYFSGWIKWVIRNMVDSIYYCFLLLKFKVFCWIEYLFNYCKYLNKCCRDK